MSGDHISRRAVLRVLGAASLGAWVPACLSSPTSASNSGASRLDARPGTPTLTGPAGKSSFEVSGSSSVVYVPERVVRDRPTPLLVFLHGALRTVDTFVEGHRAPADAAGVIVLAPFAAGSGTWDAIRGSFGPDPKVINESLRWVFDRWTIDPARIVLSGFSDGGTYTLAIGRANGDFFSRVVAYSPGFLIDVPAAGKPPFLVTHGTDDTVLPIDATSRVIVPELRSRGYTVDYREFKGPHAVPGSVVNELVAQLGAA